MTGPRRPWGDVQDAAAGPIAVHGRQPADRVRGVSWSSAHRSTEYRLIMTVIVGLCAAGAVGSVVPGLDAAVGAVLGAAALGAVAVVAVRRELRICRRIADTGGTRPAPRPVAGATEPRVGPGDATPVPPAPITRAGHPLNPLPTRLPAASPAASRARPSTPSGGAA